jgi:hypothetical protein
MSITAEGIHVVEPDRAGAGRIDPANEVGGFGARLVYRCPVGVVVVVVMPSRTRVAQPVRSLVRLQRAQVPSPLLSSVAPPLLTATAWSAAGSALRTRVCGRSDPAR